MISTSDRQDAVQLIDEARAEGARLQTACAELGIGTNTYRRWGGAVKIAGLRPFDLSRAMSCHLKSVSKCWRFVIVPSSPACRPGRSCRGCWTRKGSTWRQSPATTAFSGSTASSTSVAARIPHALRGILSDTA